MLYSKTIVIATICHLPATDLTCDGIEGDALSPYIILNPYKSVSCLTAIVLYIFLAFLLVATALLKRKPLGPEFDTFWIMFDVS